MMGRVKGERMLGLLGFPESWVAQDIQGPACPAL